MTGPTICEATAQWLEHLGSFLEDLQAEDPDDELDVQEEIRLTIHNVESLLSRLENL